jgi:hypothetical protein
VNEGPVSAANAVQHARYDRIHNAVTVSIPVQTEGFITILLLNCKGQTVYTNRVAAYSAVSPVWIPWDRASTGIFYVRLSGDNTGSAGITEKLFVY